jgi:CRISPR-associated endoribonuclease Cas6
MSYLQESLSDFGVTTLTFALEAHEPISFGEYDSKGYKWRDAFGSALKKLVCSRSLEETPPECAPCGAVDCVCRELFVLKKPRPFLMRPELDGKAFYRKGEAMGLEVTLLGNAAGLKNAFVKTIGELGIMGIGRMNSGMRGRFVIRDVKAGKASFGDISGAEYPLTGRAVFEALTPLKMREEEAGIYFDRFDFAVFFKLLINRIINLNHFYGKGRELDKQAIREEKEELLSSAGAIITEKRYTDWDDAERFSAHHGPMKVGGQKGLVIVSGDLKPHYAFLKFGEVVGVGSNTASGYGRFSVRPLPPGK